jgi:hypothetical protein
VGVEPPVSLLNLQVMDPLEAWISPEPLNTDFCYACNSSHPEAFSRKSDEAYRAQRSQIAEAWASNAGSRNADFATAPLPHVE